MDTTLDPQAGTVSEHLVLFKGMTACSNSRTPWQEFPVTCLPVAFAQGLNGEISALATDGEGNVPGYGIQGKTYTFAGMGSHPNGLRRMTKFRQVRKAGSRDRILVVSSMHPVTKIVCGELFDFLVSYFFS